MKDEQVSSLITKLTTKLSIELSTELTAELGAAIRARASFSGERLLGENEIIRGLDENNCISRPAVSVISDY